METLLINVNALDVKLYIPRLLDIIRIHDPISFLKLHNYCTVVAQDTSKEGSQNAHYTDLYKTQRHNKSINSSGKSEYIFKFISANS